MEEGMFQLVQSSSVSGHQNTWFCSRILPADTMSGPLWKVLIPVSLKLHRGDQEFTAMIRSPTLT